MSDEGEKMCPLCAEEMDLTDQQLKPCKCGYEICVWCWHHIMDMAEKDESEGRCPACRTPYDKKKIVGMAASCERMVAETNIERKKSQKAKSKTSEGRKQLTSVRVIQRNLVYIVGLPFNLADEDLLQRKEYFGQYGKVLKVSISRTSAGTIQQFQNSTCSVYITYSKEEEAVRCIQCVHGFILEGRCLRACFGTTKYCHAWLRNAPCNNPDCLYLHEVGSQEDSFTKDEIISAYTRSRVQQITGTANNMQGRSGNVLPPPSDDYCSNSSAASPKPAVKNAASTPVTSARVSTPPSNSGRTGALPPAASWGTRALNGESSGGSTHYTIGPSKHKSEAATGSVAFATAVLGNTQTSSSGSDLVKQLLSTEESVLTQPTSKLESIEHLKRPDGANPRKDVSEVSVTPLGPASMVSTGWLHNNMLGTEANFKEIGVSSNVPPHDDGHSNLSSMEKERNAFTDGNVLKPNAEVSSIGMGKRIKSNNPTFVQLNGFCGNNLLLTGNHGLRQQDADKLGKQLMSPVVNGSTSARNISASQVTLGRRYDVISTANQNLSSGMLDIQDEQLHVDALVSSSTMVNSVPSINLMNHHFRRPLQHATADGAVNHNVNLSVVHKCAGTGSAANASAASLLSNGHQESFISSSSTDDRLLSGEQASHMGRYEGDEATVGYDHMLDIESSIISNILSLDLDDWDESLTSPHNVAKLFREPGKPHVPFRVPSSWKAQNSNQSRFSFARQDELRTQLCDVVPSLKNSGEGSVGNSFSQAFSENRESCAHSLHNGFGFDQCNTSQSDNFSTSHSGVSVNKNYITRAHISAPPGFSVPSRQPPPGFSFYERNDQIVNVKSGNHSPDASSLVQNAHQTSPGVNLSDHGDIEFVDPAILAVGKGRFSGGGMNNVGLDVRSVFLSPPIASENEVHHQALLHSSVTPRENPRYGDIRDDFTVPNDAYNYASGHNESSVANNLPPLSQLPLHQPRNSVMSNGHWDAWSELQAGNDMAEALRNERPGFKFYGGYVDPMFQMPSSTNLYNRTFGM